MSKYTIQIRSVDGADVSIFDTQEVAAEHRGWSAGPFVQDAHGNILPVPFEVKTGHYKKGEGRDAWSTPAAGVTYCCALTGKHKVEFRREVGDNLVVILEAGKSIVFSNAIPHKWRVLEDSYATVVRSAT